jgi:hypothetical protein
MPGVKASLTESRLHGAIRRRWWVHPDVQSHSVLVLTADQLHAARLAGAPKPDVVAKIEGGSDLGELLGPLTVVVELAAVRAVKLDLLANSLAVEYGTNGASTGRLVVVFAAPEAADACFMKLWRRLGTRLKLQPHTRDAWSAARAPLALLIGALALTAALALALSVIEDTASDRAAARLNAGEQGGADAARVVSKQPEGPTHWLGWRGVCALGGVAAAGGQVWLYRRLTHPPERLKLVRI